MLRKMLSASSTSSELEALSKDGADQGKFEVFPVLVRLVVVLWATDEFVLDLLDIRRVFMLVTVTED